jgi:polyphosphate kinase
VRTKISNDKRYFPKELSWLLFNERVLAEARNPRHPAMDRLRFLAIYSNNLDEFYRVRVATLRRLEKEEGPNHKVQGRPVRALLREIQHRVVELAQVFEQTFADLDAELEREGIRIVDESQLEAHQIDAVREHFQRRVRPLLVPILLPRGRDLPLLHDHVVHLALELEGASADAPPFAVLEVPTDTLSRFLVLPAAIDGAQCVMLLEDVVRWGLKEVFSLFQPTQVNAWAFKVTRDAELDLDQPLIEGFLRRVSRGVRNRATGTPVRMVHDRGIPPKLLSLLLRKLELTRADARIPGMRYHNFKDFMGFPGLGRSDLSASSLQPLPHPQLSRGKRNFDVVARKDTLLHFPYQSFHHFLDFLREAAIDPLVTHIRLTVYRVSQESSVLNALVNAARNGKKVTVLFEVLARFDEENNIAWADYLSDEGVEVILGVRGLKVHCKLCLVTRRDGRKSRHFAAIGTGNFNEDTARVYTDHMLLTADPEITDEVLQVFEFFRNNYKVPDFKHLVVSPFDSRKRFLEMIEAERQAARKGKESWIRIRLNNLADEELIEALYDASRAGVTVQLLVRSMNSLVCGLPDLSENIEARCLVGRFLEHSRMLAFANGGKPQVYLTSGDWMPRNMDGRVEVAVPLRSSALRTEMLDYFAIQWRDTENTRLWDCKNAEHRREDMDAVYNCHVEIRQWLEKANL